MEAVSALLALCEGNPTVARIITYRLSIIIVQIKIFEPLKNVTYFSSSISPLKKIHKITFVLLRKSSNIFYFICCNKMSRCYSFYPEELTICQDKVITCPDNLKVSIWATKLDTKNTYHIFNHVPMVILHSRVFLIFIVQYLDFLSPVAVSWYTPYHTPLLAGTN